MKVGEYVRTPYGIRKVKEIRIKDTYLDDGFYVEDRFIVCGHKAMQEVKSSPNIIDLIEVGDYVNGYKVTYVANEEPCPSGKFVDIDCDKDSSDSYFFENDIKTIVTKEQFSQMEYRIGE